MPETSSDSQRFFSNYLAARRDYRNHRNHSAIQKLLKLDQQVDNADVNHLLVKTLVRLNNYSLARVYVLARVNSYLANAALTRLMIRVLLKNYDFIRCREILTTFKRSALQKSLLSEVGLAENRFRASHRHALLNGMRRFYHLAGNSLIKQRLIFQQALCLPLNEYLRIAKRLLVDPFLRIIMRVSILDTVRKLDLRIKLRYRWLDQKDYWVDLARLTDLTRTESYRQVMKIADDFGDGNPVHLRLLKQNLRLQLTYLYPFNDAKIHSPSDWVQVASLRINGQQPDASNHKLRQIYFEQAKLNRITNDLAR